MLARYGRQSLIVAVAATTFFFHLGKPRLWDRDEPRNARCAAEMQDRGDWLVPTFNGELRAHKPILLYWLMLSAYAAFGQTEFAARFWSAVLGVGTALLTYGIGRRLYSKEVGLWAGLILATSLNYALAARAATPDAALVFATTLCLWAFARGVFPDQASAPGPAASSLPRPVHAVLGAPSRGTWVAVYAAMGLAALAKGPVGVVLPSAAIGLFLLYVRPARSSADGGPQSAHVAGWAERARRALAAAARPLAPARVIACAKSMRPLTLLAVVAAVSGPWYLAVHVLTSGAWTEEFFLKHNLERASSALEGHRGPVVYYPLVMLAGFFPWSVFAVPAALSYARRVREGGPHRAAHLLLGLWIVAFVGAFSLAQTKLPNYVLPVYPALALLTAAYLGDWLRGSSAVSPLWNVGALAALALAGAGIALGLRYVAPPHLPDVAIGEAAWIGLIPVAGAVVAALLLTRPRWSAAALAISAAALCAVTFGVAVDKLDRQQPSEELVAAVRRHADAPAAIAAYRHLEPSLVYYAGQNVPTLTRPEAVDAYFEAEPSAYLVVHAEDLPEIRYSIPDDATEVARLKRFLKDGEIVVLARPRQAQASSSWMTRARSTPVSR